METVSDKIESETLEEPIGAKNDSKFSTKVNNAEDSSGVSFHVNKDISNLTVASIDNHKTRFNSLKTPGSKSNSSKRIFLPAKLSSEAKNVKCVVKNTEKWNKYMVPEVKQSKRNTHKRNKHSVDNTNANLDVQKSPNQEINDLNLSEELSVMEKFPNSGEHLSNNLHKNSKKIVDPSEIQTNENSSSMFKLVGMPFDKNTEDTEGSEKLNDLDNSSRKSKKLKKKQKYKTTENYREMSNQINSPDICFPKTKKSRKLQTVDSSINSTIKNINISPDKMNSLINVNSMSRPYLLNTVKDLTKEDKFKTPVSIQIKRKDNVEFNDESTSNINTVHSRKRRKSDGGSTSIEKDKVLLKQKKRLRKSQIADSSSEQNIVENKRTEPQTTENLVRYIEYYENEQRAKNKKRSKQKQIINTEELLLNLDSSPNYSENNETKKVEMCSKAKHNIHIDKNLIEELEPLENVDTVKIKNRKEKRKIKKLSVDKQNIDVDENTLQLQTILDTIGNEGETSQSRKTKKRKSHKQYIDTEVNIQGNLVTILNDDKNEGMKKTDLVQNNIENDTREIKKHHKQKKRISVEESTTDTLHSEKNYDTLRNNDENKPRKIKKRSKKKHTDIEENSGTADAEIEETNTFKKYHKQNPNKDTIENILQSEENVDTPQNFNLDETNNSPECLSLKSEKSPCINLRKSQYNSESNVKNLSNINISPSKNREPNKKLFEPTLEIKQTNVNSDPNNKAEELEETNMIKLRNKYSVLLNCNLNPSVCLKNLDECSTKHSIIEESQESSNNDDSIQEMSANLTTIDGDFVEEVYSNINIKSQQQDITVDDNDNNSLTSSQQDINSINEVIRPTMLLRDLRIILNDLKHEKKRRKIIKLNRNWNLDYHRYRLKSAFRYKYKNNIVSLNSRNSLFFGAQLTEGFIDNKFVEKSPLKIVAKSKTHHKIELHNKEINLPVDNVNLIDIKSSIPSRILETLQLIETPKINKNTHTNQLLNASLAKSENIEIGLKIKPVSENLSAKLKSPLKSPKKLNVETTKLEKRVAHTCNEFDENVSKIENESTSKINDTSIKTKVHIKSPAKLPVESSEIYDIPTHINKELNENRKSIETQSAIKEPGQHCTIETVTIKGVATNHMKSPEKIFEEGTNASKITSCSNTKFCTNLSKNVYRSVTPKIKPIREYVCLKPKIRTRSKRLPEDSEEAEKITTNICEKEDSFLNTTVFMKSDEKLPVESEKIDEIITNVREKLIGNLSKIEDVSSGEPQRVEQITTDIADESISKFENIKSASRIKTGSKNPYFKQKICKKYPEKFDETNQIDTKLIQTNQELNENVSKNPYFSNVSRMKIVDEQHSKKPKIRMKTPEKLHTDNLSKPENVSENESIVSKCAKLPENLYGEVEHSEKTSVNDVAFNENIIESKNNRNLSIKSYHDARNYLKEKRIKEDWHVMKKNVKQSKPYIKNSKIKIDAFVRKYARNDSLEKELEKIHKEKTPVRTIDNIKKTVSDNFSQDNITLDEKFVPITKHTKLNEKHENKSHNEEFNQKIEESEDIINLTTESQKAEMTIGDTCTTPRKEMILESNSDCSSSSFFKKPKHVFKFLDKSNIKRPPSRMYRKVKLNRPSADPFKVPPSPISQYTQSEISSRASSKKADSPQSEFVEPFVKEMRRAPEKEMDIISIYAETIGAESVADFASVKNDSDSDDFNDLMNLLPNTVETLKHTNVTEWVENTVKICEISKQKNIEEMDETNKLSPSEENVEEIKSDATFFKQNDFTEEFSNEISNAIPSSSTDCKLENTNLENNGEPDVTSHTSLNSCKLSENFQAINLFKNMCMDIKRSGECSALSCLYKHEFPIEWKTDLKKLPMESILALYEFVKEKKLVFLFKKIFSIITEYLGDKRDFNNLIKMVKDVLEININSDRAPFINDIIVALCKTGVTFHSIVEVVYKNANVNENLINLLSDILLNLTIERGDSNDNWPIIKEIMQHKSFDIDIGIIQAIIIESLEKDASKKDLFIKVYHDLIKRITNRKLSSIFESLLNNFYNRLLKYNLTLEANEIFTRCQLLNITLGSKSDHSNSPASPVLNSPSTKNVSKVSPFQKSPKKEIKIENVLSPVVTPSKVNFVTPLNKHFNQIPSPINPGVRVAGPIVMSNTPLPTTSFRPQRFTQPRPPIYKNKPVVNQKMPWYPPQTRNRYKPLFSSGIPGPSRGPFKPTSSNFQPHLNKEEIKKAVHEEHISVFLSLIMKYKDNHLTDSFVQAAIEAMLETKHNYPTFFGNLCQTASFVNSLEDKTLGYVLKTIGLNIIVHLTRESKWNQAYLVYKTLKTNFHDDVLNVKLYLPGQYSYFGRVFVIAQIHIHKSELDGAWTMLREHTFMHNKLWQMTNTESEICERNKIIEEILAATVSNRVWRTGLNMITFLIKNNVSDIDVKKYISDILFQAINSICEMSDIMEFINSAQNWYIYINKHIFRAIVSYAVSKGCWSLSKKLYEMGYNLEIYPKFMGNERCLTIPTYYVFEEMLLMLDLFFQNMVIFRPILHNVVIRVLEDTLKVPISELPNNLKQYQITAMTIQVRIINILNNYMKPALSIVKQNNSLVINSDIINKHLESRVNNG